MPTLGPSAMSRGGKQRIGSGEDHLIPVMNLMVILIPFLLQAAVFVTTVALQVTLPPRAAGGDAGGGGVQQTLLMVGMSAQRGFLITNDAGYLPWIPLTPTGEFDYEELRRVLLEDVKEKIEAYRGHDEIYLAIQDDIPFNEVINLMDAVRGSLREVEIRTEEDARHYGVEFQAGIDQKVYVAELFPNVIFGGAVPQ